MAGQEIASFFAKISADTGDFKKGLDETKDGLSSLETASSALGSALKTSMLIVGTAIAAVGAAVATAGFQFDAMKEQADIAFTTMLGSGEAAQGMLDELQSFAAKTPFEFPDLIRASQRMMAMGFASEKVIPTLTAIGDAVAALGGGQFEIDRVTTALGQMNAKGKTSAEEMMQLTEAGIPAWQMLADKIGVTVPEAMKMVTKGAINAQTTISAVTEGIEKRFGGMMAAQSLTFNGLISNLKDNFTQLSGQVMQPFFDLAKVGLAKVVEITSSSAFTQGIKDFAAWGAKAAKQLADFAQVMVEWGTQVLPPLWENLKKVVEAVRDFVKPLTDAITKFFSWKDILATVGLLLAGPVLAAIGAVITGLVSFLAPILAVVVAVAALRKAWENDFLGIRTIALDAFAKLAKWFEGTGIWKGSIQDTLYGSGGIQPTLITWSLFTQNKIAAWVQGAKDKFEGWKGDVIRIFTVWTDTIVSKWHEWTDPTIKSITDWAAVTKSKFENWVGWIKRWIGEIKDWIVDKWEAVLDWFSDHVQPMVNKGKAIIQGLWDGIKDKWYDLTDWFSGVWGDLTRRFKSFFGIHSPSKVFAGYGEDISLGLAKGIGGASGAVYDAMDGLTPGLTSNVNVAGGSASMAAANPNSRVEELLAILIQELRSKNMTANVTVNGGGGSYGALVSGTAGLAR